MPINQIQFQHGLSLPEFLTNLGTEQQCEAALVKARRPSAWRCAHCGCSRFFHTRTSPDVSELDLICLLASRLAQSQTAQCSDQAFVIRPF